MNFTLSQRVRKEWLKCSLNTDDSMRSEAIWVLEIIVRELFFVTITNITYVMETTIMYVFSQYEINEA